MDYKNYGQSFIAPPTTTTQYRLSGQPMQPQYTTPVQPVVPIQQVAPITTTAPTYNQIQVPITTAPAQHITSQPLVYTTAVSTTNQIPVVPTTTHQTTQNQMVRPIYEKNNINNINQPLTYQQQILTPPQVQQPAPATNNNTDLKPVPGGLCQMLSEQKIRSTMDKKKNIPKKVVVNNVVKISPSNLIGIAYSDGTCNYYHRLYSGTEVLITNYKQVLTDVYKRYIGNNPHNRALNDKFMFFSKTLTESLFDLITKYQRWFDFYLLYNEMNNKLAQSIQPTQHEYEVFNRLKDEEVDKECDKAIKGANSLLSNELDKFNKFAQQTIHDSADHLFGSNNQGDSVDDMAADDCVFDQKNIRSLFPESEVWSSQDSGAKDAFLKKLSIDGEDPNANTHFICDISTFTNALLAAAESTFEKYSDQNESQRQYVGKFIKYAGEVATEGWKKYQILFKHMSDEQKEMVRDKYKKIFTNIQQCMDKYNYYLKKAYDENEEKKEKNVIEKLMNRQRNVKLIKPPKELGMINNGASMVGLNFKDKIFGQDLFK